MKSAETATSGKRLAPLLRRIVAEPLVHFLVFGLALFALYETLGGESGPESDRIEIDGDLVDALAKRHSLLWHREPTTKELRALVGEHLRDEIFFREGMAAGLADDDEIIRRRVRQKLEVLAEESGGSAQVSDAQLQAFMDANPSRYEKLSSYTFDQVFFDPSRRTSFSAAYLARQALGKIDPSGGDIPPGDTSMLSRRIYARPIDQVAKEFGADFARELEVLEPGRWSGPVKSAYGVHLVRLIDRKPGGLPALAEVRTLVERDWEGQRRQQALDNFYRTKLADYEVVLAPDIPRALQVAR